MHLPPRPRSSQGAATRRSSVARHQIVREPSADVSSRWSLEDLRLPRAALRDRGGGAVSPPCMRPPLPNDRNPEQPSTPPLASALESSPPPSHRRNIR